MQTTANTLDWLLAGDPAIRWQVMRDLLGSPEAEWQAEQRAVLERGWACRLLSHQNPDGGWGEGVYSPKWTSTTYTLLALRELGLPGDNPQAQRGARKVLDQILGERFDETFKQRLAICDRCIVGMVLSICVTFGVEEERVEAVIDNLLSEQMADGGWNCRQHIRRQKREPEPHHSSFHTTLNVLDGLRDVLELRPGAAQAGPAAAAERHALELLLQHRLFRSDKTGQIIHEHFTRIAYPYRWHYDYLRGLEYFARAGAPRDPRLQEAIDLLRRQQRPDGHWPNQMKHAAKEFFHLETGREGSRMNTLRALRVLKWWDGE